ncbi:hypothetical protein JRC04_04850 [Mycolicibacterium sp. S2-37]|uniref:hypothetical protein n=1 Tax=Mycolicibacterium sp. S2-37 TaxID=2810297 RepID=UPI001A9531A1|nr:hypothetical protein [Mycolicibacterium sp. S2-37]MBO0676788.1 hypothetical protein [Mycolicibacterium sp. S2-37]
MPHDLTSSDIEAYTQGRLSANDPETVRALDAALARARNFCGWHVSPVCAETIVLDGSGSYYLALPTLKIVSINTVTVDGIEIDDVAMPADAPGMLARRSWGRWPCGFSNVEVDFTHGFTATQASDFREAILRMVDQAASLVESDSVPLKEKKIDDITYKWSEAVQRVSLDQTALGQYRLFAL